jgi:AmmeMemoRadiSam system protein B
VAGRFYPGDPSELRRLIQELLASASATQGPVPKAVIVPHAGYLYSGPIAASAYSLLARARDAIKRVVLLGPSHYADFEGLASVSAAAFVTPLGTVPVDLESEIQLSALPHVKVFDEAHELEHALEVQLPFLQVVLRDFVLVPLLVGQASVAEVAKVLDLLWDGPETRFVISSDLSHFLDSDGARALDGQIARRIEELDFENIDENQACGRLAIAGLLQVAAARHLRPRTLDLRNSGDTAGPRHRVVGYGAFAFEE